MWSSAITYIGSVKVKKGYTVRIYRTADCPDIYAWFLERAAGLCRARGRTGMIVPLSVGFSAGFSKLREFLLGVYGVIGSVLWANPLRPVQSRCKGAQHDPSRSQGGWWRCVLHDTPAPLV